MRDYKDRVSKWLITHHGDAIVRLAGVDKVTSWRPAAAEVVQPKQIPDGLLEVVIGDSDKASPFLIEVETYPDARHPEQMLRDALLVRLDRGVWPDAVTLVLRPHGQASLSGEVQESSQGGTCHFAFAWRVIEFWKLKAEDLLAGADVGLVPLAPLTMYNGTPAELLQKCRDKIDAQAKLEEHDILLVATQLFAKFVWKDQSLLALLGGKAMITEPTLEHPYLSEILAEDRHKMILNLLKKRFGEVPGQTDLDLRKVYDLDKLEELFTCVVECPNLAVFQTKMRDPGQ